VSGVNLVEGGTLKVLSDFLVSASAELDSTWEIIALVNSRGKMPRSRAKLIEISWPKKSWLNRLYFEWRVSSRIARRLHPDVWFAIHDITPLVGSVKTAVYCHNPMPFYSPSVREARYDVKAWLFSKLYGYLYGIGIKRNFLVVVQQDWIRRAFCERYGLDNVLVAYPDYSYSPGNRGNMMSDTKYRFLFPSLARPFKNFEVICRAAAILEARGVKNFRIVLTIDAAENNYARDLISEFGHLSTLEFVGRQTFDQMQYLYERSQCLIFPSRIETWGLPITEAKARGLHLLVAREQYAFETVGTYDKAAFFATSDEEDLAGKMLGLIEGRRVTDRVTGRKPEAPFVEGWAALVRAICGIEKV
jgi:glycosyltransferase involved in cell wall biosynthesis